MKKNIKIFIAVFAILLLSCSFFITNTVNAVADPGAGSKKFVACQIDDPTGPTQYGNTCDAGTKTCSANPCGQ